MAHDRPGSGPQAGEREESAMIEVRRDGTIAQVVLNRPEAMNALSKALRKALFETMEALSGDPEIAVIILTGAGERAFTAGLDLKELAGDADAMADATTDQPDANPVRAVERCPKPVIGAINGVAITGGFELALACDVLIASSNARFADTHARVGIMPGWGLSQKLSRLVGIARAKQLSLSGNFLDAATAERWGLVNKVVAPEDLIPTAMALARDIASAPPAMVAAYKRLIDEGFAMAFGQALAHETKVSRARNAEVTPDKVAAAREGVQARGRSQAG
jgi:enoyl-CoA hydratase